MGSLETALSLGADLDLFDASELQVVLARPGRMRRIRAGVLQNLHVVFEDPRRLPPGMGKFVDHAEKGKYRQVCLDMVSEILSEDEGAGGGGKEEKKKFWGEGFRESLVRFDDIAAEVSRSRFPVSVHPIDAFHSFLTFIRDHLENCRSFYLQLRGDVTRLISVIERSVRESEEKVSSLSAMKETNKRLGSEQGELHKENLRLKKEVEELTAAVEQHAKVVEEDTMTITRAKLMVGQEMASSYALYQNRMADLKASMSCEFSMRRYSEVMAREESAVRYVALFHSLFEVDFEASQDKVSELHRQMVALSEDRIHRVSDRAELQALRKEITAEIRTRSGIIDLLVESQRRMENLAKVIRMKNAKYSRIEALNKNIAKENDTIKVLRGDRYDKNFLLKANLSKIASLQDDISARSDSINQLDQFASDFVTSRKELAIFLEVLNDLVKTLDEQLETLPGTLQIMAAFFAYCGHLDCVSRRRCLELWRSELSASASASAAAAASVCASSGAARFRRDFLRTPLPLPRDAAFRAAPAYADVQRVFENMSALQFLPPHLVVVDPLSVSIEFLFKPSRTGVVYCGDPNFEAEFASLASKFDSVIVRHFAFDGVLYRRTLEATSGEFDFDEKEDKKDKDKGSRDDDDLGNADTIDDGGGGGGGGGSSDSLKRSSTSAGRGRVVVYHVTPEMPPPEVLRGISPLSVLDFSLTGRDLHHYIFRYLRRLVAEAAAGGGGGGGGGGLDMETEEERLEKTTNRFEKVQNEVNQYLSGIYNLSNMTQVKSSVGLLKRLRAESPPEGAVVTPALKFMDVFSKVAADCFACLSHCPLQNLRVAPIKTFMSRFRQVYEHLHSQSATPDVPEMALRLSEAHAREFCGSLTELDFVVFSSLLVFFLFLSDSDDVNTLKFLVATALSSITSAGDDDGDEEEEDAKQEFVSRLEDLHTKTTGAYVSSSLVTIMKSLYLLDLETFFSTAKGAAEKLLSVTHSTEINLEKIYAHTRSKTILIRVSRFIPVYEVLCRFARKQEAAGGEPVIFDVETHREEHFWLLEEAMFAGRWVVCFASDGPTSRLNYLRFLLEKCSSSPPSSSLKHQQQLQQQQQQQQQQGQQAGLTGAAAAAAASASASAAAGAPAIHDSFRMWVLCSGKGTFTALTSMTAPSHCVCLGTDKALSDPDTVARTRRDVFSAFDRVLREREHRSTVF